VSEEESDKVGFWNRLLSKSSQRLSAFLPLATTANVTSTTTESVPTSNVLTPSVELPWTEFESHLVTAVSIYGVRLPSLFFRFLHCTR
jgi:hypothetical protein